MLKHRGHAPADRKEKALAPRPPARTKAAPTPGEIAILHRRVLHSELRAEETADYQELERF